MFWGHYYFKKKNLFYEHIIEFYYLLELNDNKYERNGTIGDENYWFKLVFTIEVFVSFGTDFQLIFYYKNIIKTEDWWCPNTTT